MAQDGFITLPGGRITNSDIVPDMKKELEGSEIAGTSTSMSIFQKFIYGSSQLQPNIFCRPSFQVMVAENIHHHRCWYSTSEFLNST